MKKLFLIVLILGLVAVNSAMAEGAKGGGAHSAGNYTIGIGPIGNVYVTDRRPEMSPGVGAVVYFDYRWSPELSTTASVMMLVQDGTDADRGENNIVYMGIPTFDLKYYFITNLKTAYI